MHTRDATQAVAAASAGCLLTLCVGYAASVHLSLPSVGGAHECPSESSAPVLYNSCLPLRLQCSFKLTEDELAEGKPPCVFWWVGLLDPCVSRACLSYAQACACSSRRPGRWQM